MGQWRKPINGNQRFARVRAAVPVRVSTVDPEVDASSNAPFFRCAEETTANLSNGGAFVLSWEPLAAGRRVVIDIEWPEEAHLHLVGRVAWTQRQMHAQPAQDAAGPGAPGYGVEFLNPSVREVARLERFLESRARESRAPHTGAPTAQSAATSSA